MGIGSQKISLQQFCEQWVRATTMFERNIENIRVGSASNDGLPKKLAEKFQNNIGEGSYFGDKYDSLKPETLKKRRQRLRKFGRVSHKAPFGDGTKPLLETGILWDSITYESRKSATGGFKARIFLDPRSYRHPNNWRHNHIYGRIHNDGVIGKIPMRRFMGDDGGNVESIANGYITTNIFLGLPGSWRDTLHVKSKNDRTNEAMLGRARAMMSGFNLK